MPHKLDRDQVSSGTSLVMKIPNVVGELLNTIRRVNIPASKVVMAFGFYGRSFQLSDLSCSTPGCQFSGGGSAGPCSATSGILYYYEIQALLKQHTDLKPIWDKDAAVKYVVYDKNQWISYDDPDTFKQKVEWANSVGLGGSLIWASDTGKLTNWINSN
ncbi:hypothetical protein WAI453_013264 [Rhynchosporium graminicola]